MYFSMTNYESEFCFKFEISISHMEFIRALILLPATALLFVPNAIIFALIIRKRQLRQVRFYIIANLTICDSTSLVLISVIVLKDALYDTPGITGNFNLWAMTVLLCTYLDSLTTTAFLAIDRYTAVKHGIRYHEILTRKKAIVILVLLWVLSVITSLLPLISVSTLFDYFRSRFITLTTVRIIVGTLLILASNHTSKIRKQHIAEILKRERNFGVEREKLDLLQRTKISLKDAFKLYIATIIVMLLDLAVGIFELTVTQIFPEIHAFVFILTHAVDIIVLALTQRDIRRELKHVCFICCQQNRVQISEYS